VVTGAIDEVVNDAERRFLQARLYRIYDMEV